MASTTSPASAGGSGSTAYGATTNTPALHEQCSMAQLFKLSILTTARIQPYKPHMLKALHPHHSHSRDTADTEPAQTRLDGFRGQEEKPRHAAAQARRLGVYHIGISSSSITSTPGWLMSPPKQEFSVYSYRRCWDWEHLL
jgi:hypothetical protein